MKLTAKDVRSAAAGKYSDGNGLILHVVTRDRRQWVFRYQRAGKERAMGLGSALDVSLDEARELAQAARKRLAAGVDPIDARRAEQALIQAEQIARTTFVEAAAAYIAAHEAGWRNPKHRQQWRNTLATYVEPIIGTKPVSEIDVDVVLKVLQPIWNTKTETASRVRSRIEAIIDYAAVRGWRPKTASNPALWRGNLKLMLPAKAKVHTVEHHAALDWREAPAFMVKLRNERDGMGARALEFAILTAVRSGEVREAAWSEFDLDAALWTIPAARMKAERAHRVPLSRPALAILHRMAELQDGSGLVFLGLKHGVPLSDMTLTAVLRRMGLGDLTAHGFRSTFRDWAAETTAHPGEVVEMALAHAIGDKTEAAYRRGDLFNKRAALMNDWANYLARPAAKVVSLHPGQPKARRNAR